VGGSGVGSGVDQFRGRPFLASLDHLDVPASSDQHPPGSCDRTGPRRGLSPSRRIFQVELGQVSKPSRRVGHGVEARPGLPVAVGDLGDQQAQGPGRGCPRPTRPRRKLVELADTEAVRVPWIAITVGVRQRSRRTLDDRGGRRPSTSTSALPRRARHHGVLSRPGGQPGRAGSPTRRPCSGPSTSAGATSSTANGGPTISCPKFGPVAARPRPHRPRPASPIPGGTRRRPGWPARDLLGDPLATPGPAQARLLRHRHHGTVVNRRAAGRPGFAQRGTSPGRRRRSSRPCGGIGRRRP